MILSYPAGLATGILHTFMGIPAILAGILTQLGLYSINLKTMGKANQAINVDKFDLLVSPGNAAVHIFKPAGIVLQENLYQPVLSRCGSF